MQTAAFHPLDLLLVLLPFDRQGLLSPQLFHQWFPLARFLGVCFMFALARELGLRRRLSLPSSASASTHNAAKRLTSQSRLKKNRCRVTSQASVMPPRPNSITPAMPSATPPAGYLQATIPTESANIKG